MKISALFQSQPQTFSFEFFPPKTPQDVEELFVRARELQPLGPSFISVTYGAGGTTRRNTIDLVCRFQAELSLVAMAHVTFVRKEGDGAIIELDGPSPHRVPVSRAKIAEVKARLGLARRHA